jgi:Na+-transporting NADH:ubiquinone oxidoreductase subunit F
MLEAGLGIVLFTAIVLILTIFVLVARRLLVPRGQCLIEINAGQTVEAQIGQQLLTVCRQAGVQLPSACGGAGTCGLCKLRVLRGGAEIGPQELAHLQRREVRQGTRLACQVRILGPMSIEVDEAYLDVRTWRCRVEQTRNVSTLIREIELRLPDEEQMSYRAGAFVELTCPPFELAYSDFEIESEYRDLWDAFKLWELNVASEHEVTRAYSMANHPGEKGTILLNIRLALPPPGNPQVPPGLVSSWLFSLKPGDSVDVRGPYGHFAVDDSQRELVFIGGGAGMAPLRAQILDLLRTRQSKRKISYWYGARSQRELFYTDLFDSLHDEHDNFEWHPALSEPQDSDEWEGDTGFIHQVVYERYLARHATPQKCEYYLCGPPMMVRSALEMLAELGVSEENIHYDDFSS